MKTGMQPLMAMALATVISCSAKPDGSVGGQTAGKATSVDPLDKAIVGKWKEVDSTKGADVVEFFPEGTITIAGRDNYAGNYRFVDTGRIRLDLGGLGALAGPMLYEVSISGNRLTMKDIKAGEVAHYERSR